MSSFTATMSRVKWSGNHVICNATVNVWSTEVSDNSFVPRARSLATGVVFTTRCRFATVIFDLSPKKWTGFKPILAPFRLG